MARPHRKRIRRRGGLGAAAIWAWLFLGAARSATGAPLDLDRLDREIDAWRLASAREMVDALAPSSDPQTKYLVGKLLFYEGNTREAIPLLRQAIEGNRADLEWKGLRDRAALTDTVFEGLEQQLGPSGRFSYRFARGIDDILIPYAEDALSKQLSYLSAMFGDAPARPVQVVFLPDSDALAAVSGLSVEQIERTGTVGVTKYGRIMIVSPRSLVTGYPWLDTLAHELTHYIITRVSGNNAPIWLHEGIAKLVECRWRSDKLQTLTPEEAYLLDRAVIDGRLIPLRRFHPSVAYLSDQEEAALAYAQVLSFLKYIDSRMPERETWMPTLLSGLAEGRNINGILVALTNVNLQRLFTWWRKSAQGRTHTPSPAVGLLKRQYKRGEMAGGHPSESLHDIEVRRHLRLGDLLRLRGHIRAATTEYLQAKEIAIFPSPEISDRLGAALISLGEYGRVVSLLAPMVDLYPSHATTHIQLAKALAGRNELTKAVTALRRANAINPFDPVVHCMLADLFFEMDKEDAAAREKNQCRATLALSGKKEE